MALSADQAETIGKRALEVARKNKLNPMAVCVLNGAGQCLYSKMELPNPLLREGIARGKAMGALGLGVDSANMVKVRRPIDHAVYLQLTDPRCTKLDLTSSSPFSLQVKGCSCRSQEVS